MELQQLSGHALRVRGLYAEYERRFAKEWSGLNTMEGFVGDVGDLMKIIMAKEGLRRMEDIDAKLAHELADCLYSVLVLAAKYNVDLEKEFVATMETLEKGIQAKLRVRGTPVALRDHVEFDRLVMHFSFTFYIVQSFYTAAHEERKTRII